MGAVQRGRMSVRLVVSVTGARLSPSEATTGWQRLEITFLDACGKSSIMFHVKAARTRTVVKETEAETG